jgi:hypothetical protein
MSKSDAPVGKTEKLVSGKHINATGLAMILAGSSEERKLDAMRLSNLKTALAGSTDAEIDAAIRSAEEKERITGDDGKPDPNEPVNFGPAVVKMVKLGMTLKTAKVRISETRAIVRAIRAGFAINPKDGWHRTIIGARETLDAKKDADAKVAREVLSRDLLAEGLLKHGDDIAKARAYMEAELEKHDDAAATDEAAKDVERMVKRLQKLDNATLLAVIGKCAESLNYKLVKAESAPKAKTRGKVKSAAPVEVPPMPAVERETETAH